MNKKQQQHRHCLSDSKPHYISLYFSLNPSLRSLMLPWQTITWQLDGGQAVQFDETDRVVLFNQIQTLCLNQVYLFLLWL